MVTGNLVAAHRAQFLDALFGVGQLGTGTGRVVDGYSSGSGHGCAAAVAADGHVLLETVHGTGHGASVSTCGTEQIRCVHITELIAALVTATGRGGRDGGGGGGAHHRVRGGRGGRGRLMVVLLGLRLWLLLLRGRRRRLRLLLLRWRHVLVQRRR